MAGRWFSLVSSTNKTDLHDKTEILLIVALNTLTLTLTIYLLLQGRKSLQQRLFEAGYWTPPQQTMRGSPGP